MRITTTPATTTPSATAIPSLPPLPAFPGVTPEVVQAIVEATIPAVVAALTPSLSTPAPVAQATARKTDKASKKARKAAARAATQASTSTVEMVTYRKQNGAVKTATRKQYEARLVLAQRIGHTLEIVSTTTASKPAKVRSAQATPAPVVEATSRKAANKAANKALAAALRAQGLNPADPQVWAAAKAQQQG